MTSKNDWFSKPSILKALIILLVVLSSIIFIFEPEIQLKLHVLQLRGKSYKIIYLVNDLDEHDIPTAGSTRVYSTLCTLGLSEAVNHAFNDLNIPFESKWFETDKFGDLNATYLDSFDLIVIGGILYWWQYASNNDRAALTLTRTLIVSSAYIGIYPDLNDVVGVYTDKESTEAWETSVLSSEETLVQYHAGNLNGYSSKRRIMLIDVIPTPNVTIIATATRENKIYPYLIYNGVKNYYINTYTYPGIPIALDISIVLDEKFNLYPDSYFYSIKYSSSRRIINTLLIPIVIMISSLLCQNSIKIKDRKLKLDVNKIRTAISISTLLLITFLLLFLLLKQYFFQISIENYISIELLIGSVLLFMVLSFTVARDVIE